MGNDPAAGLIGTYVRLRKRGGTYRVVRWESFQHRYVLQSEIAGTHLVYARPDELVRLEDGQNTEFDNSELGTPVRPAGATPANWPHG
jgi:hypothetical protein